jgi:outer membrane lipoprotein-sorting protein
VAFGRACRRAVTVAAAWLIAGCAPSHVTLPSGAGTPFPSYAEALAEATSACRGVRTYTAELAVSGHVGGQKLRGRVAVGLADPDRARLEGVAPFGPPAFILVAEGGEASLLLPRDNRILRGEKPEAVLESLVGVRLGPADLRAILSGCPVPHPQPTAGAAYPGEWARIDLPDHDAVFLRRGTGRRWQVQAARVGGLDLEYERDATGAVTRVRLVFGGLASDPAAATDLRLSVSQVETNVDLASAAFAIKVPANAVPLTLAELREAGPVGERK